MTTYLPFYKKTYTNTCKLIFKKLNSQEVVIIIFTYLPAPLVFLKFFGGYRQKKNCIYFLKCWLF